MKLLVINRTTLVVQRVEGSSPDFLMDAAAKADQIASSDALGPESITWAIEEYGRCDGIEWTIIPEEWEHTPDVEQ